MDLAGKKFEGLSPQQVKLSRKRHGRNTANVSKPRHIGYILWEVVTEPMFLLLLVTCLVYFILSAFDEGLMMILALLFVSGISIYQELRSNRALDALKAIAAPTARVIRDGQAIDIPAEDIVIEDLIIIEEGALVPADAMIIHANDFMVNEAILTGESYPVYKDESNIHHQIYFGTLVTGGLAVAQVNAIGQHTAIGKLGKSLEEILPEKTVLQKRISQFVRKMAIFGAIAFLLVWGINYWQHGDILASLLQGLTLAMSVLPEEIPVAFSTFMAIGAWRLIRNRVLTKRPQTVESLGAATVICIDKTGTITENSMQMVMCYDFASNEMISFKSKQSVGSLPVLEDAMWASEPHAFDPMEVAIHRSYAELLPDQRSAYQMIHEYPLEGKPPMMTHIYENDEGSRIIAAKGGWESILRHSENLSEAQKVEIAAKGAELASQGYRVLATAHTTFSGGDFPRQQQEFAWQFSGLIALEDPPKANIQQVLQQFYQAGIKVIMITGDYPATAQAIARQAGFKGAEAMITGDEVMQMDDATLQEAVTRTQVFARMFPDAKLRVVQALKARGEVVAMTGDGVNDGPALQAAHIGVAMGQRGSELAKRTASMILLDDDLSTMVTSVAMGRKIYENLKKAIRYIISIHIPILLTVTIPLLLGWKYPNIFSPIHVIFLELVMGPTCSIIYENEPLERGLMQQKPRAREQTFFSWHELSISILQGLIITLGVLAVYQLMIYQGQSETVTRTMVFSTLIAANIFLTLANRSFRYSIRKTIFYRNQLLPGILLITIVLWTLIVYYAPLGNIFSFTPLQINQLALCAGIGLASVIWIEFFKPLEKEP